jgi:hypothetical protein
LQKALSENYVSLAMLTIAALFGLHLYLINHSNQQAAAALAASQATAYSALSGGIGVQSGLTTTMPSAAIAQVAVAEPAWQQTVMPICGAVRLSVYRIGRALLQGLSFDERGY